MENRVKVYRAMRQEAGLDKETARQLAENPRSVASREGLSDELRFGLDHQDFETFLTRLFGEKDADSAGLLTLANVIYRYSDRQAEARLPLTEADKEVLTLGVRLLEEAFYDGRLMELRAAQSAHLAFLINVVSKVLSVPENRKVADRKNYQLRDLLAEVVRFYNQKMTKEYLEEARSEIELAGAYARNQWEEDQAIEYLDRLRRRSWMQDVFGHSRFELFEHLKEHRGDSSATVAGLYYMKTSIIAADYRRKLGEDRLPFVPEVDIVRKPNLVDVYSFLPPVEQPRFSDLHFYPRELPFTKATAAYFQEKSAKNRPK